MQEILVNVEAGERRVAILKARKLEWYFVERIAEKRIAGNIYKGRVSSILDGMGAAFIDCGLEKNGFLYVSDIITPEGEDSDLLNGDGSYETDERHDTKRHGPHAKISELLKKDQEILVQVTKEALGTKGARITTHLSLPGRHLVLMPNSKGIGVSRKIRDDHERKRIRGILSEFRLPPGMGLVARTAAEGYDKRDLWRDAKYLLNVYARIMKLSRRRPAPVLIFEELDIAAKTIRDFLTDEESIVIVDNKDEFKKLKVFAARINPKLRHKVTYYGDETTPLFEKYGAEKEIDKLFERKVYLKCGGYITIEQTEGMIAIDVNSGKFTGKKNLEDTIFKVNCEAAEEIARQLRLRDIGGIVVIDFIDMMVNHHRREVFGLLSGALRKDKARTHLAPMSEFNVVEMTRQRVRRSLESVSYETCPYCFGKGMVKSPATVAILVLRKLKAFLKIHHRAHRHAIEVVVHPLVAQRLVKEDQPALDLLRRRFRNRIVVISEDKFHVEDIDIRLGSR